MQWGWCGWCAWVTVCLSVWSTPCTTETKTDRIRRVAGHMPHPRMAQSQAERSPLYLFHSTGEESPGWTFSSPRIVGCILGALLCLAPWGFPRNLWSSTTGNLIVMGKGVGLATTSTWISADGVPTCRAQVVIQTSSYAHLQNRVSVVQPD